MDEGSRSTAEICSFQAVKALDSNILDLTKKRKLQPEQFDLPVQKHRCLDQGFTPFIPSFGKKPEIEKYLPSYILKGETEVRNSKEESQNESIKDSNSFAEDADSTMSVDVETNFKPYYTYADDKASTSSLYLECNSFENASCSTDSAPGFSRAGAKGKLIVGIGQRSSPSGENKSYVCETLEEHLLEFGFDEDFNCLESENDLLEQFVNKEVGDIIYPDGVNQSNYILSSGQWNADQETQAVTRKPTIDQEFEEYFSTLMM